MEEAHAYLRSLAPEKRPQFVNLAPYNIVVQDTARGTETRWSCSTEPPASVVVNPASEWELMSSVVGAPVWFPDELVGFTGLPLSPKTYMIVPMPVGQLMRRLHYCWAGHVLSPDTESPDARWDAETNTWYVRRLFYWRLMAKIDS